MYNIFGSNPFNMSFTCGSRVWEPSVPDRTIYRVSYILRLEKLQRVHHFEHFQARKSRIAIEFRRFVRLILRVEIQSGRTSLSGAFQHILETLGSRKFLSLRNQVSCLAFSFLSKASASLNTGFPFVKYKSHTPSQEIVKSGALQGILHSRSKFFEPENAAKMRYRVVFAYYVSRTENHKRYIQQMC